METERTTRGLKRSRKSGLAFLLLDACFLFVKASTLIVGDYTHMDLVGCLSFGVFLFISQCLRPQGRTRWKVSPLSRRAGPVPGSPPACFRQNHLHLTVFGKNPAKVAGLEPSPQEPLANPSHDLY